MKTIIILSVVAIVGAALLLAGCKPPRSPEQRVERFFEDISDKLDLSETQKIQLLSIKGELLEKGREMRKDRERMHEELSRLILSSSIDVDEVKAEAKKKHDSIGDLIELTIDRLAEFHATLTPEQKKRLVDLMEKHKRRMKPPWVH